MKIAVLGTRGLPYVPGGVEARCENLYPRLIKKACEVTVFTRKPYVDISNCAYKGVRLIHLFSFRNKFFESFFHTFSGIFAAKKISPDIVHIHGIGPSLVIPIVRLLGLKVVMTHHGTDYKRKKWNYFAKFVLSLGEYLGVRFADSIICVSKSDSDMIKNKYGKDATVIPNGAQAALISQDDGEIRKYGLTKGKYILCVGRFVPEKGFHDLVRAFEHIRDYKLVMVGESDHPDKYSMGLKERAKSNNSIILTGFLTGEPLRQLYSHAGLFVLPSYHEGLPIVLLEAMSYGLSCIASDIPATRELGLRSERLFKAGDVFATAAKIREYIDRPIKDEEKKKQIDTISERYNWENIADRVFEVYREVAKY